MAGIVIKPRARILHGHDWVFSSEVLKVFGNPVDGDVISLKDGKDHLIGSAIYNSKSQIVARRFSRRRQDLDKDFFQRRIQQASEYRDRRNVDAKLRRIVWSESDGLPGLIIDRYGDNFVLQTLTLAMDMRKDLITAAIEHVFCRASASLAGAELAGGAPALQSFCIIERNDVPVRKAEGLELRSGVLRGTPSQITIEVEGIELEVDFLRGHKTGLYLDQKHNYGIVSRYARDRRVLDCFTNQGAFALSCARAGATEITGVEENLENIAAAKRNAARNELKVDWIQQDVFQFLRGAEKQVHNMILSFSIHRRLRERRAACTTPCAATENCICVRLSCYRKMVCWRRSRARITWITHHFCK
jgi:23S rRNA (cytosine1962-C5)-methyltransferase